MNAIWLRATACVVLLIGLRSGLAGSQSTWPREQPPPPLAPHEMDLPPYALRTLANGLQVLVVPHHEQPSVAFRLLVRAGAVQEPTERPGVASFVAALLNQGTTSRSAEDIATLIDSAGGFVGVGAGNELTYIQGAVIKDRTDAALGLVAEMVQHPAFPEAEIQLQRRQALSALQVANDDPDYIAGVVFDRLVFGPHPYGRPGQGTVESLERVTRDDLVAYHHAWFVPNNSLLAIVGDLSTEEAFAAAERAFAAWPQREVPEVKHAPPPAPSRRVVVIDRPGSAQTAIRMGHLAFPRTHPDYTAFDMAIRILGGEGANRLFGVLRSERGLTYSASADFHAFKNAGVVIAETDTRTSTTGEALRLMVDEFARLQRELVHPTELQGAQDFFSGNFPLSIETPSAIAEQILTRLFFGLDLSEIDDQIDRVTALTEGDIQRVARQWLKPDQLTIVLVGDASAFASQLKAVGFGTFERIPLAELDLNSASLRRTTNDTAGLQPLRRE